MMLSMAPAKVVRIRGKPETFSPEEIAAIRAAIRGYYKRNGMTGAKLGEKLGVSQQTANGYVNGTGGFSLPTARAIAWMLGYDGIDELLREHGALKVPDFVAAKLGKSPSQGDAARMACRLGVSETAIERVNARIGDAHHIPRWWMDKYIQEQAALDEERLQTAEDRARSHKRPTSA